MMNRILLLTQFVIAILLISACSDITSNSPIKQEQATNTGETGSKMEPFNFKISDNGKITLHGRFVLVNPFGRVPDPNDGLFLVPLQFEGESIGIIPPFEVGKVPQAEVDERTGEFVFTNIEPGQYAIVVLTLDGEQVPASYYKKDGHAIINLEAGDRDKSIEIDEITF